MRRLVVNCTSTFGKKTGIGQYTERLVRSLENRSEFEVHRYPYGPYWVLTAAAKAASHLTNRARDSQRIRSVISQPMRSVLGEWRQAATRRAKAAVTGLIRSALSTKHYDLYHEPNYFPLPTELPTVSTVHDLTVLLYPEWHPARRVRNFEQSFATMLRETRHIVADSDWVRRQIIQLLGVSESKVSYVHPGIRDDCVPMPAEAIDKTLRSLKLTRGYLLCVGAIEPRKNLLMAMKAYGRLDESIRRRHPLVLAGPLGWRCESVLSHLRDHGRHQGVIHLGYVPDSALPALYNGASALLYPSHDEGFGLPPLEMAACGGAVLASDIPTLRETLGDFIPLIDPCDEDAWHAAILRTLTEPDAFAGIRDSARRRAASFTWSKAADELDAVYGLVLRPKVAPLATPTTKTGGESRPPIRELLPVDYR